MNGNANLQTLGVTAKNSNAADLAFSQSFSGNGTVPSGASLANVSATDAVPTTKTDTNGLTVTASASSTLTWDANGNLTSDGTNSYKWDAENRLIEIDYAGINNYSQFSYDGLWRNTKIVETTSGSVTSTKQFVCCNESKRVYYRCEERDGTGALTKQYLANGQLNGSTKYFYSKDHLGSVREMTDNSGIVQAEYRIDSYGRCTPIIEIIAADFNFAGYYSHTRSGMNLTAYRAYHSTLARWISRDPIEEAGGVNLFAYVGNNPISRIDPSGLDITGTQSGGNAPPGGGAGPPPGGGSGPPPPNGGQAANAAAGAAAAAGTGGGGKSKNKKKKEEKCPKDCNPPPLDDFASLGPCLDYCHDFCNTDYDYQNCWAACWDRFGPKK
ncbi:MAG: RHS repeat-associated core domain-containing protein [Candidatus Melainabacteria bacterium]|nr:RHS repeat-associated core domain-containing protein [Candidatus Melainabacteria bacterium]